MGAVYKQYNITPALDIEYSDRRRQRDYKLFVSTDCDLYNFRTGLTDSEALKIDWIIKPAELPDFIINRQRELISALPIKHGEAKYMPESKGYFFFLTLRNGLKLTITQYEEDIDEGAYVNFILNDKIVASDIMPIPAIIDAVGNFYRERDNG